MVEKQLLVSGLKKDHKKKGIFLDGYSFIPLYIREEKLVTVQFNPREDKPEWGRGTCPFLLTANSQTMRQLCGIFRYYS